MAEEFFVSFNSPQCGWMSIGFEGGGAEFHTTTAYTPHANALTEIMDGLRSLLESPAEKDDFVILWSRNPEAFDFHFKRDGKNVRLEIFQFPSFSRPETEREKVFEFEGDALEICRAFYETFAQMYEDRNTDEFEQNWRQPFPQEAFERFNQSLQKAQNSLR